MPLIVINRVSLMKPARQFEDLSTQMPDDLTAGKLADRCRRFASDPPSADWDGSVALDEK